MEFSLQDERYLLAAEGWFELGNWLEANGELECITASLRMHPRVLKLRWEIYARAKKWELAAEVARTLTLMLPEDSLGYIHYAYCLQELNRSQEAFDVLAPISGKFPTEWAIPYNLACYACQLGKLQESLGWLEKAIVLADNKEIRITALDDPHLEPLWKEIGKLC